MRGGTQGHCWLGVLALTDLLTHVPCLAQSAAVLTPEHMVVHGWAVLLWGTLEVSSRRALGWHYVMGAGGRAVLPEGPRWSCGMGGGRRGCAEPCSGVCDGVRLRAGPCLCFPGLAVLCCSGFTRNHVPRGHLGWGSEGEIGWPFCPGPSPASGASSSGRRGRPREPAAQSGRPLARTVHRLTGVLLGLGPWETEAPALHCQACSPSNG